MSAEEFRERLTSALQTAVAGEADLDDLEAALDDAQDRLDRVRAIGGGE